MQHPTYLLRGYILTPGPIYRMAPLYGIHFRVIHKDGSKGMTRQEQHLRTLIYCYEHGIPFKIKNFENAYMVEYRKKEGWVNLEAELEDEKTGVCILDYLFYDNNGVFSLDVDQYTKIGKSGKPVFDKEKYADMICLINSSATHKVEWYYSDYGPVHIDDELKSL